MMENTKISTDVIIIGGGLIGLLQALSLARFGISSSVIDKSEEILMLDQKFDGRTSAITSSSLKMFELIGLDVNILGEGEPVNQIIVRDGHDGSPISFGDDEPLAKIFENQRLRLALLTAAKNNDAINMFFSAHITEQNIDDHAINITLDKNVFLHADLLIGADGSNSNVRKAAKIGLSQWSYDHVALVGAIAHTKSHKNIAYELFFPEGPLALLPMPKDEDNNYRSSLIWSVPEKHRNAYQKLSPTIFCNELNKKTNGLIGGCKLINPLMRYPLGFHSAACLTAKRTVLIGDSAHRVHPIAGQGLNLGFRDVAALTEVLVDGIRIGLECGDAQNLDRYERWRSVDNLSVSIATDSINRIYAMRGKAISNIRKAGMNIIQNSDSIKNYLTLEARGATGQLPKMLSGLTL